MELVVFMYLWLGVFEKIVVSFVLTKCPRPKPTVFSDKCEEFFENY